MEREDLPTDKLKELADVIGVNQVKAMLLKLPGYEIYVPKSFLYKKSDMNYIRQNPNKKPVEIAEQLGCSLRTAYRKKKLNKPL